jgi:hypothetical protein
LKKIRGIFIIFLFSLSYLYSYGQADRVPNLPAYDRAPYHFGFTLALNQMFFTVDPIDNMSSVIFTTSQIPDFPADSAYVLAVQPVGSFGFTIGIVTDLTLGKYFNLRFVPDLAFGERELVYSINKKLNSLDTDWEPIEQRKRIYSTFINFPLHIKYKSQRLHNTRAYILGGVKYSLDLASEAKKNQDEVDNKHIRIDKHDFMFEIGVGFDFYTTYFKFGTELKMGYSLNDILIQENNIYTDVIDKITSKIFQLTFTFE